MTASQDAYMMGCTDVTVFRGRAEHGYPFLSTPTKLETVLVYSLDSRRPQIKANTALGYRTEWYAEASRHAALLDRLTLIVGAVLADIQKNKRANAAADLLIEQEQAAAAAAGEGGKGGGEGTTHHPHHPHSHVHFG